MRFFTINRLQLRHLNREMKNILQLTCTAPPLRLQSIWLIRSKHMDLKRSQQNNLQAIVTRSKSDALRNALFTNPTPKNCSFQDLRQEHTKLQVSRDDGHLALCTHKGRQSLCYFSARWCKVSLYIQAPNRLLL